MTGGTDGWRDLFVFLFLFLCGVFCRCFWLFLGGCYSRVCTKDEINVPIAISAFRDGPVFLADVICIYTLVSKWYFRSAVAVVVLSILL